MPVEPELPEVEPLLLDEVLLELDELPFDVLKIDRSFIKQLDGKDGGTELVKAIVSLAHSLDMEPVAEGPPLSNTALTRFERLLTV